MAAKTQQRRTQVKLTMRKKHRSGQLRRRHHLQLIVKAEYVATSLLCERFLHCLTFWKYLCVLEKSKYCTRRVIGSRLIESAAYFESDIAAPVIYK